MVPFHRSACILQSIFSKQRYSNQNFRIDQRLQVQGFWVLRTPFAGWAKYTPPSCQFPISWTRWNGAGMDDLPVGVAWILFIRLGFVSAACMPRLCRPPFYAYGSFLRFECILRLLCSVRTLQVFWTFPMSNKNQVLLWTPDGSSRVGMNDVRIGGFLAKAPGRPIV